MLEENDFPDPFPAGLLHAVAVLEWNAVKAEPAVKAPESAVAEPTETVGVCPVFVVVTPSKPHAAVTTPAADTLRKIGENINAPDAIRETKIVIDRNTRLRSVVRGKKEGIPKLSQKKVNQTPHG